MAIYGNYPVLTHLIDYRRQTLIRWQSSNFNNAIIYFLNAFLSSSYCASKHHFCFFFFFSTSVFGIIVTFLFDLLAFPDATERWREVNKWVGLPHMYLDSSRYESLYHTEIFFKIWGIFSSLWTPGHPATHLCLLNTDLNLWTLTHFYSACAIHLHGMEIVIPTFPGIIFTVHVLLNQFRFFSTGNVTHRNLGNPGRRSASIWISERNSILQGKLFFIFLFRERTEMLWKSTFWIQGDPLN